ncbi:helix-turn-helix domain-containing protein [Pedobacter sp. BS3]|uniref:helix-turn-helix domain-containing protein n=1 Tax=Pedobacter sp. BS3 TaxID=2567937 RepID=UPI001F5BDAC9|nr:helix-turn-helix domain-containing protein [Pedobacter sp. BS3]
MRFYDILVAGGVLTSFLTSLLLFTRGRYQLHANRLLGVVIFTWGWYALLYLLVITGWIRSIPWIHRVGSPLYYLIPPCSYLYVRSVLLDETKFRKCDWLHFIPALINVIDLMPFYLADMETKKAVVNAITTDFNLSYQKGSGMIPAFWHFQLRWIQGIVYLVFQWALLYRITKKDKLENFSNVTGWLFTFSAFSTIIYTGLGIMSVIAWLNLGSGVNLLSSARSVPALLQILGFMCLSVYLFFKPDILYGIPREVYTSKSPVANTGQIKVEQSTDHHHKESKKDSCTTSKREAPFNPELMNMYVCRLETYVRLEEPFKKQGFTVNELALALQIPLHHLSYVLNHYYKQRFTDFINTCRVNYVKKRLEREDWRSFTLEALANEAGFASRSTFFTSFKKVTGLSPSQYLHFKD